jgi:hypothetical protein
MRLHKTLVFQKTQLIVHQNKESKKQEKVVINSEMITLTNT